ncbi:TIR domain-containing protein [Rhizobium leguminosarum]|uniref:TIR domain-containing protein n=1 Tax=Rhizobium leguminosarum TaxID=384 RepID=UPI001C985109|nr:TIR domain-containing protein [Rhizobium leguminosarum]MBY5416114.1 TIR domain-containing protein [Rhizobium leguminosarum]
MGIHQNTVKDFDVFLSFNSVGRNDARELRNALHSRGLSVWFDEEQIRPGMQWQPRIEEGISRCGSVVVALGDFDMGPVQRQEVELALIASRRLSRPVIPCLLPGYKAPDYPTFLDTLSQVDFRSGYTSPEVDRLVWGVKGERPTNFPEATSDSLTPTKWLLVAGSGSDPLPSSLVSLSRELGRELASSGWGLVTGGWRGIDHLIALSFSEQIRSSNISLSSRLIQIMPEGSRPHFPAGRLVNLGTENDAWRHSVERADAIILVGGLGGTYQTGTLGLEIGKGVFSLPNTREANKSHADAFNFYYDVLKCWSATPLASVLRIDEYEELAGPASTTVSTLIDLLRSYFERLRCDGAA